jgi:hypothetical protein
MDPEKAKELIEEYKNNSDDLEDKLPQTARITWNALGYPEPTQTFENELPSGYPSWNYFIEQIRESYNGGPQLPKDVQFYVIRKPNSILLYKCDLDYIKARAYEELAPVVDKVNQGINEPGLNHFYDVVSRFRYDYKRLFDK